LGWQKALAEMEGLLVEPTSAIVVGAAEVLKKRGVIKPSDRVLLPLTGFGIKEQIPGF
jgi:threonine synthase